MDTNSKNFWEGFEKRASGASKATGLLAGGAAAGGLYKLIRSGLENPHAGSVAKALGGVVRKAEQRHPALGPAASWGIPIAGGAATAAIVSRAVKALQRHHAPKSGRIRKYLSEITDKLRKHYRKWVGEKK